MKNLFFFSYRKRWCFLIMKRTKTEKVFSFLFQLDILTDNIRNVCFLSDFIDGFFRNSYCQVVHLFSQIKILSTIGTSHEESHSIKKCDSIFRCLYTELFKLYY